MQTIRIINGKRYNTQTATQIAHYWNGLSQSDFRNVSETLYKTGRGAWFLVGHGGALSVYAESCGNASCGGSDWRVLSPQEAFEWLESHRETEALEAHFNDHIQDA